MKRHTFILSIAALMIGGIPVLAGPPLICHPLEIGKAKSLPWAAQNSWNGVRPDYPVTQLTEDTLGILHPGTPLSVRMETIRRAAIYAAKDPQLVGDLTAQLTARALNSEAAGKPDAQAWFDAGYWVETVRQAAFIYKHMLTEKERKEWTLREGIPGLDGRAWVKRAIQLGGKNMDQVLGKMDGFRDSD